LVHSGPATAARCTGCCLLTAQADGRVVSTELGRPARTRQHIVEDNHSRLVRNTETGEQGCRLCGADQDSPLHFFLECPALSRPRTALLAGLERAAPGCRARPAPALMEIILYGLPDPATSLAIRDTVQNFVVTART